MLQNAYFLEKIGADTAENEQQFAEILPTDATPRLAVQVALADYTESLHLKRGGGADGSGGCADELRKDDPNHPGEPEGGEDERVSL